MGAGGAAVTHDRYGRTIIEKDMPFTDWLDERLAIEEHVQGLPWGQDASHCCECADEARKRAQAECRHLGQQLELTRLHDPARVLLCSDCGLQREVPR